MITSSDGVVYRKCKPYTPQNKKSQSTQCVSQLMAQLAWCVASETIWPQEAITSEQSIASTYKQT